MKILIVAALICSLLYFEALAVTVPETVLSVAKMPSELSPLISVGYSEDSSRSKRQSSSSSSSSAAGGASSSASSGCSVSNGVVSCSSSASAGGK